MATNCITIDDPVVQIITVNFGPPGASPLTTKGDVFTYDTDDQRLAVGTDGQVLTADSTQATGLKYATPSSGNPFDQDLNTTDSVDFVAVAATGAITADTMSITAGTVRGIDQDLNTSDAPLFIDLDLNNGTTASELTVTNTDDGAGNTESLVIKGGGAGQPFEITAEAAGTGVVRDVKLSFSVTSFDDNFILRSNVGGANEMRFLNNGLLFRDVTESPIFRIGATYVKINQGTPLSFGNALSNSSQDAGLSRLSASSLAIGNGTQGDTSGSLTLADATLNNGTTASQLTVTNTDDGAGNTETLVIKGGGAGQPFEIASEAAGTGVVRDLGISGGGSLGITITSADVKFGKRLNCQAVDIQNTGTIFPQVNMGEDLGGTVATIGADRRYRSIYTGDLAASGTVTAADATLNNGTTASELTVTNTDDGAGNTETLVIKGGGAGQPFEITAEAAGTGVVRDVKFTGNVEAAGTVTANGNFGSGIASPLAPVQFVQTGGGFGLSKGYFVLGDGSGTYGMSLYTSTGGYGAINFADGTGSLQQMVGQLKYDHASDKMSMRVGNNADMLTVDASGNLTASGTVTAGVDTVANLPASPSEGDTFNVTDCNTSTWGATVVGSGSVHAACRYNGTVWTVTGI